MVFFSKHALENSSQFEILRIPPINISHPAKTRAVARIPSPLLFPSLTFSAVLGVGKVFLSSQAALPAVSSLVLQVIPVNSSGSPVGEVPFVRSGLLGFVGPVREALQPALLCPFSLSESKGEGGCVRRARREFLTDAFLPCRAVWCLWWGRWTGC